MKMCDTPVLYRWELYKLFSHKALVPLIAAGLAVQLFMVWNHYRWHDESAWERITFFPYSSGTILIGMIIVLAVSSLFNGEEKLRTEALLLSTQHGRRQLVHAKIAAALSFTTIIVTSGWLVNLIANISLAGWAGWQLPLQSLSRYALAPYTMNIGEFVVVQFITNWLGCMAFCLFVIFLSARSSSELAVFFIAGLVFVMPFFTRNSSELSVFWLIKHATIIEFARVENLFNRPRFLHVSGLGLKLPLHLALFYGYTLLLSALFLNSTRKRMQSKDSSV
ncbi:hypothetical protein EBB07_15055 [Paenibacillaceae bacterium]|nr:hypothetical protein EBB07_15055 [Paenibacillaceae bacterium]